MRTLRTREFGSYIYLYIYRYIYKFNILLTVEKQSYIEREEERERALLSVGLLQRTLTARLTDPNTGARGFFRSCHVVAEA